MEIYLTIIGCKFLKLKPLNFFMSYSALFVSVEGCKFVELKPSANAMKFINFILC